jgi:hypothetical protein
MFKMGENIFNSLLKLE